MSKRKSNPILDMFRKKQMQTTREQENVDNPQLLTSPTNSTED